MNIKKTKFKGVYIIEPDVFRDHRGFFIESYNKSLLIKKESISILSKITILFQRMRRITWLTLSIKSESSN